MSDLSRTIAPKSDQLNADDLIAGPITIRVTRVNVIEQSADQPVSIYFEGDDGKPYKPCKSMRRVLVGAWGKDGTAYAGRRMTLFRDDKVMFGGAPVGGIRISHLSDIPDDFQMSLTVARAQRRPYKVGSLPDEAPRRTLLDAMREQAEGGAPKLKAAWDRLNPRQREAMQEHKAELDRIAQAADQAWASDDGEPDAEREPADAGAPF